MAIGIGSSIGRIRPSKKVSPSENAYARVMAQQCDDLVNIVQGVVNNITNATPQAIKFALEPVMKRADELVPELTGKLRRSQFNNIETHGKGRTRVVFGYARFGNPHYAAMVHERLDLRHAKGKQAKFLEQPLMEQLPQIAPRIAYHLKYVTGLK